jgi:hypothetical protein
MKGKTLKLRIYCDTATNWDLWSTSNAAGGVRQILENPVIKQSFLTDSLITVRINSNISTFGATKAALIDDADIILISYGAGFISDNRATVFRDFVYNDKGVVILCYEAQGDAILEKMFDASRVSSSLVHNRCLLLDKSNSIVNGEYTDLTNQYIGLDGSGNRSFEISGSTTGVEEVVTTNGRPFSAKAKGKNFIVIGDGGIFAGGLRAFTSASTEFRPLQVSTDGTPEIRNKNGEYRCGDTYNAHFFLNIIHWAIRQRLEGK